jgi:hypothetical protein
VADKIKTSMNARIKNLTHKVVDKMQILSQNGCMQYTEKLRGQDFCREISIVSQLEPIINNRRYSSTKESRFCGKDINLLISCFPYLSSVPRGKWSDNASDLAMNFPIYYSLIILISNDIYSYPLTFSLNKQNIHYNIRKVKLKI